MNKQRRRVSFFGLITYILFAAVVVSPLLGETLTAVERAGEDWVYASTARQGMMVSSDEGKTWRNRSSGLPVKQVWPFDGEEYRRITDIATDTEDRLRAAVTTSTGLYLTENGGARWRELELDYPVKSSNYLTSVAFDSRRGLIYLGTSFSGLFVSSDEGRSWEKLGDYLGPLYKGAGFYKEITDISVRSGNGTVYLLNSFDERIYLYTPGDGITGRIEIPSGTDHIEGISEYRGKGESGPAFELHGRRTRLIYSATEDRWRSLPPLLLKPRRSDGRSDRNKTEGKTEGKRAIYLNAYNAYGSRLEAHLDFLESHGFNAVVVDVKDDWGRLTYNSQLERHERYGAVRGIFDLRTLVEKAHAAGIEVIGRMVVFKDKLLYHAEDYEYAVWDPGTGAPWGHRVEQKNPETGETEQVQREFWVDPFSEEVWDYNIAIVEELQELGIDEVQFDYIRFPSDGKVSGIEYRYRRRGMNKTEAIESFLKKVREKVHITISADLYGFNSWYRMGNWIGQDIEMLSHYADVICPMFYPSHFPSSFLPELSYIERAYRIYREGTSRARSITEGRSSIRPYVQAFLMGGELSMEQHEYERYLTRQIEGTYHGGGSGYTLWNNMNRYYMVNSRVGALNDERSKEPETDT